MGGVDRDNLTRVLCTGSDGFIGSSLVKKLDEMELDVICVDKHPRSKRAIRLDVANRCFLPYFTSRKEEYDYVFHLGSPCSVIQFHHDPVFCVENTLTGFRQALRIAEWWEAKFIYPSSGNVYGAITPPHREELTPQPSNLYGVCKHQCEKMARESSTETLGLRIYAGYGPGEERKNDVASVIYLFLQNMINRESPVIWGDGTQTRDFIHIDDVTDGLIKAMNVRELRVINLGTGTPHSYNEVIDIINEVMGLYIRPVYIEKPKNYVDTAQADVSLMRRTLAIHPRSLVEGIAQFSDYLERLK